jgi:hypothetical protein
MRHAVASRAMLLRRPFDHELTVYGVSSQRWEGPMVGKVSLDGYRVQWPRVGGVLAMALGGAVKATSLATTR